MMAYILNYLLCSACLYIPYKLWFENMNYHVAKRIYLIACILFPFVIPFLSFSVMDAPELLQQIPNIQHTVITHGSVGPTILTAPNLVEQEKFDWVFVLVILGIGISVLLFTRFLKNLLQLFGLIRRNPGIPHVNFTLIVLNRKNDPFSFFNYVFVSKEDYEKDIPKMVWDHELAHVRQLHSLDVLLVEIILIFAYWNPFNWLIKNSIQLNHEYLADEAVLNNSNSLKAYQYLLIGLEYQEKNPILSSQLNFKQLKTRLNMMNKKEKWRNKAGMLVFSGLLLAGSTLLFSNKTAGSFPMETISEMEDVVSANKAFQALDTVPQKGASKAMLDEYDKVVKELSVGKKGNNVDFSSIDQKRMAFIASKMTKEQKAARSGEGNMFLSPGVFITLETKPTKKSPDMNTFSAWKNPSVYGVWIDGKKSSNKDLNNFSNDDIVYYSVSKLHGKAKEGRNYTHQIDVYTLSYYNKVFGNRLFDGN